MILQTVEMCLWYLLFKSFLLKCCQSYFNIIQSSYSGPDVYYPADMVYAEGGSKGQ